MGGADSLMADRIAGCRDCPRLAEYLDGFGRVAIRKPADADYWARPVPGFGDVRARLVIVGLAPGAHGANRTGRPFTGDAAGQLLYGALHRFGYASLAAAASRNDGLRLTDVYITNAVKCAPPGNRPTGPEKRACLRWLAAERQALRQARVLLAMGRDAFESCLRLLRAEGMSLRPKDHPFVHAAAYALPRAAGHLVATYHFSRYNVNTGLLTPGMVDDLFRDIGRLLARRAPGCRRRETGSGAGT